MFQKVHRRLALTCSLITTGIVFVILLFCLFVSEQNMYRKEEALFTLKANSVSFDLVSAKSVDWSWYAKNNENGQDSLYIEINGKPSPLTSVLLSPDEAGLVSRVKAQLQDAALTKMEDVFPPYDYGQNTERHSFTYREGRNDYMVMHSNFQSGHTSMDYLYLHSLTDYHREILRQRIRYLFIWLVSIAAFYVFSYFFTAQAMKPLIKNHEKQKQFIALASHELRSPLAVFKTGLSLLKTNPKENPKRTERITAMMDGEIGRMEWLLNDLLFLSRAEQEALPYQFKEADLSALLKSVYEKYLPIAGQKEITLTLSDEIPSSLFCVCDIQRIEQAVIILLDNALTYTPAKGQVTLSAGISHNKCFLTVRDTGCGISGEEKEKIFDRFYRADASHNDKSHFGLGLSIAREILRAHRGIISVADAPGGGSIFTIKLPQSAS